ncbi:hypothetical protein K439DRAFT_1622308 [Ramaria rubella]|nr:hypothetical protein K439DRAFT_1622308 [Ramaria rubella]
MQHQENCLRRLSGVYLKGAKYIIYTSLESIERIECIYHDIYFHRQKTHLFNPGGALNSQTTDSQHLKHVTLTTQTNFNRMLAAMPGVKTRRKAGATARRHLIQQLPSQPLTLSPWTRRDLFTIVVDLGMARKPVHDLELELLQAALRPLRARQGPETCEPSSQPSSPVHWGPEDH